MTDAAPFSAATSAFFTDLTDNNNREWFTAHRGEYESVVREPLEELLAEAEARYGSGRIMRPNRDVRFSSDKSPYKLNGALWAGGVGGVYLHVDVDGIRTGGGLYDPSRDQLQRAREAIDARPLAADRLTQIFDALEAEDFGEPPERLATAPRGYPKDHPHIDLLRLKHYVASKRLPMDATRADILTAWTAVEPLNAWTAEFAGKALSWP